MVQSKHGRVFAEGGKALVRRIGAVRLDAQPVGQFREKVVTGILYAFLYIFSIMASGPYPALDRVGYLVVNTRTFDGVREPNHPFFQGCHGSNRLEGGTRRF